MAAKRTGLARARKAAGYTQEGLAEALHVDRSAIFRWESGRSEPLPYMRPKLARLLGVMSSQLEAMLAPEPVDAGRRTVVAQPTERSIVRPVAEVSGTLDMAAATTPSAELVMLLAQLTSATTDRGTTSITQGSDTDEQLTTFIRSWVGKMNRRELLQLLGWAVATASSPASSSGLNFDEQERVAKAIAAPGRVDEHVIGHIQTVYWSCRRQDDSLGPQVVLPIVLAQLSLAHNMLADCPNHLRPRLLSTCSGLSGLAGWLFADSANYGNSWSYFERARALAHEARDPALSSFILGRMSHTAQMQDKMHLAIDYAEASRKAAENSHDALVRVHAASQTARAYAKDGQSQLCMKALDQTETSFLAADTHAAPTSLAYFYDSGSLANAKSICFLDLNQPFEAATQARSALSQHEESLVRDNAFTMLYLAKAHIQLREVDEAASVMGSVIEATTQNRSVRLLERLHSTRAAMQPWKSSEAVRTLDEQLRG